MCIIGIPGSPIRISPLALIPSNGTLGSAGTSGLWIRERIRVGIRARCPASMRKIRIGIGVDIARLALVVGPSDLRRFAGFRSATGKMQGLRITDQVRIGRDSRRSASAIDRNRDHFRFAITGRVIGVFDDIFELIDPGHVGGPVTDRSGRIRTCRLEHIDDLTYFAICQSIIGYPGHSCFPFAKGGFSYQQLRVLSARRVIDENTHGVGIEDTGSTILHTNRIRTAVSRCDIGDNKLRLIKSPNEGVSRIVFVKRYAIMIPGINMIAAISRSISSDRNGLS